MMVPSGRDFYEHGATAKKLKIEAYKENAVLKNMRRKVKYTKVKARIILLMLLVFACGMTVMYRYAYITDINYKIDEAKSSYNRLKNDNITMKVKIENTLDLTNVRTVAEGRFGMHKAQKEQIISINVPKADYINTNVTSYNNSNKQGIVALFSRLAKNVGMIK